MAGVALEERTVAEHWWSENPDVDPWEWRAIIARRGDIAYGKFLQEKQVLFPRNGFHTL